MTTRRAYASLQDWLERTGTPQKTLAQLAGLSAVDLSRILSRSRRCSLEKALTLSRVTGVAVENLLEWPSVPRRKRIDRAFKRGTRKCA